MLGRPENLPRRAVLTPEFDLSDIQGGVLRAYTMPAAAYLFLRIKDVAKGCRLLERMLPLVMTAGTSDPDGILTIRTLRLMANSSRPKLDGPAPSR